MVVAYAGRKVPFVVRIEVERMESGERCCIGACLIDAAVEFADAVINLGQMISLIADIILDA